MTVQSWQIEVEDFPQFNAAPLLIYNRPGSGKAIEIRRLWIADVLAGSPSGGHVATLRHISAQEGGEEPEIAPLDGQNANLPSGIKIRQGARCVQNETSGLMREVMIVRPTMPDAAAAIWRLYGRRSIDTGGLAWYGGSLTQRVTLRPGEGLAMIEEAEGPGLWTEYSLRFKLDGAENASYIATVLACSGGWNYAPLSIMNEAESGRVVTVLEVKATDMTGSGTSPSATAYPIGWAVVKARGYNAENAGKAVVPIVLDSANSDLAPGIEIRMGAEVYAAGDYAAALCSPGAIGLFYYGRVSTLDTPLHMIAGILNPTVVGWTFFGESLMGRLRWRAVRGLPVTLREGEGLAAIKGVAPLYAVYSGNYWYRNFQVHFRRFRISAEITMRTEEAAPVAGIGLAGEYETAQSWEAGW